MLVRNPLHSALHISGTKGEATQECYQQGTLGQYKADRRSSTSVQNATMHGRNTSDRATSRVPRPFRRAP